MLKKIRVEQLQLGMHIKEICGSWMEHPFWRSAFVVTEPKDLARIRDSSIQELWIDTGKGLDIPPDAPSISETESEAQVDAELECDITHTEIPGLGTLVSKTPRSLAFESLDQGQFYEFAKSACRHIAATYWPHLTAEAVQEMAESFVEESA